MVPADTEKGLRTLSASSRFCGRRMSGWVWSLLVSACPAQACRGTNGVRSPSCRSNVFLRITACQEGQDLPLLSLFTKVFDIFSCTLPKVACFQKFLLTRPGFCGNLSQQFNIYIFYLFAQYLRGWATPLFDFSSRYITDWQDLPKKRRHDRSVLWRLFCCCSSIAP